MIPGQLLGELLARLVRGLALSQQPVNRVCDVKATHR